MSPESEKQGQTPTRRPGKVLIVAGEASGDLHGAGLVREIQGLDPLIRFYGVGGKNLKEAGVELVAHSSDMAVVGLTEVSSKLRAILKVFFRLKKSLREERPDLVILIDYPDFNIPLARAAKKKGLKVFYYISPQVWAWRKGRVNCIRKYVDRMAVIFPFEEPFYRHAGVNVAFVGHPLIDGAKRSHTREEALKKFGLAENRRTVALLPGSREGEVTRLLPVMLGAAAILKRELPLTQFVLPLADTLADGLVEGMVESFPLEVRVVRDCIYDVLGASDAAMVASGTATVETALMETPMVVVYKVSGFTYAVGRMLVHVDHIAMANIIAGRTIVPELIQDEATPERIAKEVAAILTDDIRRKTMTQDLKAVREKLGKPGAAARAARLAVELLKSEAPSSKS